MCVFLFIYISVDITVALSIVKIVVLVSRREEFGEKANTRH